MNKLRKSKARSELASRRAASHDYCKRLELHHARREGARDERRRLATTVEGSDGVYYPQGTPALSSVAIRRPESVYHSFASARHYGMVCAETFSIRAVERRLNVHGTTIGWFEWAEE